MSENEKIYGYAKAPTKEQNKDRLGRDYHDFSEQ